MNEISVDFMPDHASKARNLRLLIAIAYGLGGLFALMLLSVFSLNESEVDWIAPLLGVLSLPTLIVGYPAMLMSMTNVKLDAHYLVLDTGLFYQFVVPREALNHSRVTELKRYPPYRSQTYYTKPGVHFIEIRGLGFAGHLAGFFYGLPGRSGFVLTPDHGNRFELIEFILELAENNSQQHSAT